MCVWRKPEWCIKKLNILKLTSKTTTTTKATKNHLGNKVRIKSLWMYRESMAVKGKKGEKYVGGVS